MKTGVCENCGSLVVIVVCQHCGMLEYTCKNCGYENFCCKIKEGE